MLMLEAICVRFNRPNPDSRCPFRPLFLQSSAFLMPVCAPSMISRLFMRSDSVRLRVILITMAALLFVIRPSLAQEVVTSPSESDAPTSYSSSTQSALQSFAQPTNPGVHYVLHGASDVSSEPRRFQYGLQLAFRGVYDDNINITNTGHISDYYFTFEPVLTLGFGDIDGQENNYLRLDYLPAFSFFLDHSENNAFQNVIDLRGLHSFGRLTLTLLEEVAILDGTDLRSLSNQTSPGTNPNLDVASRQQYQTYQTRLNANYNLSGKTFLSGGIDSLIYDYNSSSLLSSGDVSGNLFINYIYSDKLVVGLGGTGGYNFVESPNPDETFEQANIRLSYRATGKVAFNFSGGVEFRQFQDSSRDTYISPVFELSAIYTPFDGTAIVLTGTRRTYNSAVIGGQDFAGTNITASFRQRFLQRIYLGVIGGYDNSDYFSTVSSASANRVDDYYFIEPSVDVSITRFWSFGAYYLHRQNDSSLSSFSFNDNQVGFRTALVF